MMRFALPWVWTIDIFLHEFVIRDVNMNRSLMLIICCVSCIAGCSDSSGEDGNDPDAAQPADDGSTADADADDDSDSDADADASPRMEQDLDVAYTPPEDGDETMALLDVFYVPDGRPKKLLVFVHGGSWIGGDKDNLGTTQAFIPWFLHRNFVVAVPNFRLASAPGGPREVTYADQATDIAFALAWLKENAKDYGVTEPGMILLGYSSGAHQVALLAADERYLESAGMSHADLAASISFDVHAYDVPYALELMQGSELEGNIELIEFLFGDTEEEQREGSPSTYAEEADLVPTLLVSADPSQNEGSKGYIARRATERYAQQLEAWGHDVTSIHFDDETHNSLVMDFGTDNDGPTQAVEEFLEGL